MSTHLQSLISEKLKLTEWLRVNGDVPKSSEKIREDLYESFFGTIDTILNKNPKMGLGFGNRLCMNFIKKTFDKINIYMDTEPPKTFVNQTFTQLELSNYLEETTQKPDPQIQNEMYIVTVKIRAEGINMLRNMGKTKIKSNVADVVFTSRKMTKKPAEHEAYSQMMFFLLESGITKNWINEQKLIKTINRIGDHNYDSVMKKARKTDKKIKSVLFEETYNSKPAMSVFQIIGVNDKGIKKILYTYKSSEPKTDAIQNMITNYLY